MQFLTRTRNVYHYVYSSWDELLRATEYSRSNSVPSLVTHFIRAADANAYTRYVCMYVCMYARMYVDVCVYVRMYICMYVRTHICIYVCYVCISVHWRMCTYVCTYIWRNVCTYACVELCMYIYMYEWMYVFMYVNVRAFVYGETAIWCQLRLESMTVCKSEYSYFMPTVLSFALPSPSTYRHKLRWQDSGAISGFGCVCVCVCVCLCVYTNQMSQSWE